MSTKHIPRVARHLRTYAEFESYLTDFLRGIYHFLWVVGRPGTGKTESIRAAMRGTTAYYVRGGQLTALRFYTELYRHRNQPVILDDAEHILDDKVGAKLVAALGDSAPEKLLCFITS